MKFRLGGNRGLNVIVPSFPTSRPVACVGNLGSSVAEPTTTVLNAGLRYDSNSEEYVYLWKSDRRWAGTCREFFVRLTDGTEATALFRFNALPYEAIRLRGD